MTGCTQPEAAVRGGKPGGGFTLLELILAIALTVILISAAIGFFQQVVRIRSSVEQELDRLAVTRAVLDRLTTELRLAYYDPTRDMGLIGQTDQLTLLTTALPEPAAWIEDELTNRSVSSDLRQISYRLVGSQLQRTEQRQIVRTIAGGRSQIVTPLTDQVRWLRFRYWDGQMWQDTWPQGPLPMAVEIVMGQAPVDEQQTDDPALRYQRRVVALTTALPANPQTSTAPLLSPASPAPPAPPAPPASSIADDLEPWP